MALRWRKQTMRTEAGPKRRRKMIRAVRMCTNARYCEEQWGPQHELVETGNAVPLKSPRRPR